MLYNCLQGNPHLATVTDLDYLAIDETDRMTEKGHFEELTRLLELGWTLFCAVVRFHVIAVIFLDR